MCFHATLEYIWFTGGDPSRFCNNFQFSKVEGRADYRHAHVSWLSFRDVLEYIHDLGFGI